MEQVKIFNGYFNEGGSTADQQFNEWIEKHPYVVIKDFIYRHSTNSAHSICIRFTNKPQAGGPQIIDGLYKVDIESKIFYNVELLLPMERYVTDWGWSELQTMVHNSGTIGIKRAADNDREIIIMKYPPDVINGAIRYNTSDIFNFNR